MTTHARPIRANFHRPNFGHCTLKRLALAALLLTGANLTHAQSNCSNTDDLLLQNGRIHTMDANDTVVTRLRIQNGRVAGNAPTNTCTRTIDLKGRTVVPGLIDNHNHIVLLGLRPGHDTRLENAFSIAAVQATLKARAATLAKGEWITSIGGFDINQFTTAPTPPRFPTLAELDAVSTEHPIYIQQSFAGPSVTNSLGKQFFESKGVTVGADGSIAGGATPNPTTKAIFALKQLQTFEDKKRGTLDALNYAVSVGITTQLDQGGFPDTNTDADGIANMDGYRAYDALLALDKEHKLPNRTRINFLHMESDAATPQLQARLNNVFPVFGGEMVKTVGIGEFTAGNSPILMQQSEAWLNGTKRVAQAKWRNENHSLTATDYKNIIDGWQKVHDDIGGEGISKLGWVVAHAPFINLEYANKLKALGGGVSVLGGWRFISGTKAQNGPPFRMLKEAGIPMGMSSDGMQISPMNPWLGLYYVVTGKNVRGELINEGQTLSRSDALRLYTASNRWFLQENDIGGLENGMRADLLVLDRDYFDGSKVSDEDIKAVRPVLTVVGGKIVFGSADKL